MDRQLPRPSFLRTVLALAAGFVAVESAIAAAPQAPTQLLVNDVANPVGTGLRPFFGWRVNDRDPNEIQTKYQIRVASSAQALTSNRPDVWDSGEMMSRDQNHIAYAGPALAADRRDFWQVRTWDRGGSRGAFSTAANFIVGPVANEDWSGASWVRRTTTDADDYTYFRKTADLPNRPIARAPST